LAGEAGQLGQRLTGLTGELGPAERGLELADSRRQPLGDTLEEGVARHEIRAPHEDAAAGSASAGSGDGSAAFEKSPKRQSRRPPTRAITRTMPIWSAPTRTT